MLARVFDSYIIRQKTFWSSTGEVYLLPAVGLLGVVKWQVSSRDDFPNDLISPRVTCNGEMWLAGKGRICGACHNCQRQGRKQWKAGLHPKEGPASVWWQLVHLWGGKRSQSECLSHQQKVGALKPEGQPPLRFLAIQCCGQDCPSWVWAHRLSQLGRCHMCHTSWHKSMDANGFHWRAWFNSESFGVVIHSSVFQTW